MSNALRVFGIVLLMVIVCVNTTCGDDDVVGRIWGIKFEKNPKKDIYKKFRATPDGKLWAVPRTGLPREIGTWTGNETLITMNITVGETGTIQISQIGKKPPRWQGLAVKPSGEKRTVKVILLEE